MIFPAIIETLMSGERFMVSKSDDIPDGVFYNVVCEYDTPPWAQDGRTEDSEDIELGIYQIQLEGSL